MSEGAVPINVVVTGSGRRLRVTLKSAGAQGVLHALRNCDKAALTNTTLFVDDETMEQVDSIDRLERMRTYRAFMGALVRVTLFVTGRAGGVGGDGRCRLAITHEFTLDQLLRSIRTRLYIGMEYTLDLFRSEGRVPVRNVSEIGPGQEVEVHLRKRAALPLLLEGLQVRMCARTLVVCCGLSRGRPQFAHQAAPTNAAMAMAGGPALRAVPVRPARRCWCRRRACCSSSRPRTPPMARNCRQPRTGSPRRMWWSCEARRTARWLACCSSSGWRWCSRSSWRAGPWWQTHCCCGACSEWCV